MRYFAIFVALLVYASPAISASTWDHNGSTVTLEASGQERVFRYQKARPGLSVDPGNVVFSGRRHGYTYTGTAYAFSSKCGSIGYSVTGSVSGDDRTVTLRGSAPIRQNCKVVGRKADVLVFSLIQGASGAQHAPGPVGSPTEEERAEKPGVIARLRLGKSARGFHISHSEDGKIWSVTWPENEHMVYTVEDLYAIAGAKLDVLVGQTETSIGNAYAVLDQQPGGLRRMIVFDDSFITSFNRLGGNYRVILAHEIGHHMCGHTVVRSNGWDVELEADRAAGALLSLASRKNAGVGGDHVSLDEGVATMGALGRGGETHPPAEMRINAFVLGWNNGSRCIGNYQPINPWK